MQLLDTRNNVTDKAEQTYIITRPIHEDNLMQNDCKLRNSW